MEPRCYNNHDRSAGSAACCCCHPHLTPSELEVVELVAAGLSNAQIARRRHVSPHTVASQVADTMRRLDAQNRAALVARSYVDGVLNSESWPPRHSGRRCLSSYRR